MADTIPTLREAAQQAAERSSEAYDKIDRFLRNNLDDADYAEFSAALDAMCSVPAAEQAEPVAWIDPATLDVIHAERKRAWSENYGQGGKTKAATYTVPLHAAPPAPARQPAASLTVGMLMEAGLMVGSTPDSVGTSNWAVRMLGALRALAGDQPDAPPAPEPTWPEWAEQILKTVREYSGYDGYDDADGVDLHEEVCEALAELTAQIERLEAKAPAPARQEWQPIETAPRDGTPLLAYRERDGKIAVAYRVPRNDFEVWYFGGACAAERFFPGHRPSHWQPLPAAPITAAPAEGGA